MKSHTHINSNFSSSKTFFFFFCSDAEQPGRRDELLYLGCCHLVMAAI